MIKVEAFLLCDAATKQGGKLNILGAFDNIWVKEIPYNHPIFYIVARFTSDKMGHHPIKIIIKNPDDKVIRPKINGSVGFKKNNEKATFILTITKMEFEQEGKYTIDLSVAGKEVVSLPLYVKKHKCNDRN